MFQVGLVQFRGASVIRVYFKCFNSLFHMIENVFYFVSWQNVSSWCEWRKKVFLSMVFHRPWNFPLSLMQYSYFLLCSYSVVMYCISRFLIKHWDTTTCHKLCACPARIFLSTTFCLWSFCETDTFMQRNVFFLRSSMFVVFISSFSWFQLQKSPCKM